MDDKRNLSVSHQAQDLDETGYYCTNEAATSLMSSTWAAFTWKKLSAAVEWAGKCWYLYPMHDAFQFGEGQAENPSHIGMGSRLLRMIPYIERRNRDGPSLKYVLYVHVRTYIHATLTMPSLRNPCTIGHGLLRWIINLNALACLVMAVVWVRRVTLLGYLYVLVGCVNGGMAKKATCTAELTPYSLPRIFFSLRQR